MFKRMLRFAVEVYWGNYALHCYGYTGKHPNISEKEELLKRFGVA